MMKACRSSRAMPRNWHDQNGHRSSYIESVLLLCLLLGIGLAIAVTQSFGKHTDESNIPSKGVTLIYCLLMFSLYLWVVVQKHNFEKRGVVRWCQCMYCRNADIQELASLPEASESLIPQASNDRYDHISHAVSHGATFTILGTGAAINFLFEALIQIYCIVSVPYCLRTVEYILDLFIFFIGLAIVIVQIRFFRTYDRAIFKNLNFLNYIFAAAIGLYVWAWIACFIKPLERVKFPKIKYACRSNGSATIDFQDDFLGCVEPFLVESLTVATSTLFQIWNRIPEYDASDLTDMTCETNRSLENDGDEEEVTSNRNTALLNLRRETYSTFVNGLEENCVNSTDRKEWDRYRHDQQEPHHHSMLNCQYRPQPSLRHFLSIVWKHRLVIFSTLLLVLLYATFHGLFLYHNKNITEITSPKSRECIELYLIVAYFLPSTCWMFYCLHKTPTSTLKIRQFSSGDSLLLFTALWSFTIELIHIIAALGMILKCPGFAIANIFPSIFLLIQGWIQTKFIITVVQTHVLRRIDSIFIPCLIHLMLINVAEWFLVSFVRGMNSEKDIKELAPIDSMWYGEEVTRVILITLFPLVSLFRFHSSIMTYEVLKAC